MACADYMSNAAMKSIVRRSRHGGGMTVPSFQEVGSFTFAVNSESGWATNDREYNFGPFEADKTFGVAMMKTADRKLEIRVAFEHFSHTMSGPMPRLRTIHCR